jgi:ferric enterobactin receptor
MTWDITKRDVLSASAKLNNYGNISSDNTTQDLATYLPDNTLQNDIKTNRTSSSPFRASSFDWNIDYKKKFNQEGRELSFSYQSSIGTNNSSFDQRQKYLANDSLFAGSKGDNILHDRETNITLDYSQPINKNSHVDIGAKTILSRIESNSDYYTLNTSSNTYLSDTSRYNNFTYNRNVYAGYISLSYLLTKKISLKTGIREERTETNANFSTTSDNLIPSYNSFIPSATIAFKLDKNQTIKFTYSKRLQRPEYRILNPFINASDPTNVTQGNPALKPERSDYGEITYSRFFDKGGSILINGFYRYTRDDEQNYVYYYSTLAIGDSIYKNVAVNTNVNAGTQQMLGANIYGSLPIGPNLEIHGNIFAFHKYIQSNIIPGNTFGSYNYRMNLNATYKINKSFVIEFFGEFRSPRTEIQGKFPSYSTYTFAARKIFNKKLSMGFTTTNPFNLYVLQRTDVSGPNFTLVSEKKVPYQSFGINLSYKFGNSEKEKKEEKPDNNNGDDAN